MQCRMDKAIFLDRDGTIIKEVNYLDNINDVELLPEAVKGLKRLKEAGFLLIITTNQSGLARGYLTEFELEEINEYLLDLLKKNGVIIDELFYCPHHVDGIIDRYKRDCECRKPKIGMVKKAQEKYDIDLNNSYVIGDTLKDVGLAKNFGGKSILVKTGYGQALADDKVVLIPHPDYIADNLLEAAEWVLYDQL